MMQGRVVLTIMCCRQQLLLRLLCLCTILCSAAAAAAAAETTTAAAGVDLQPPYSTFMLEDLCHKEEAVIHVYLPGWSAAIMQLGQSGDGEYYDRDKHTCTMKVTTDKGFHLGGVVENIRIQGVQHPSTKRWECEDYIVFRTKGAGLVNQVLDMFLPDRLFKGRPSEKLCGERNIDTSKVFRMLDSSSHSNVFTTMASSMELEYHQNEDMRTPVNNSFTVVISTFRSISEHDCNGATMCGAGSSRGDPIYCVHKRYRCDGHINCALPAGGTDERGCPGGEVAGRSHYSAVFSSTIIIFIALGSIVGAMILLVILYSLVARARGDSNRSSPSESTTAVNYTASSETADIVPTSHRSNRNRNRSRNNRRHSSIDEGDEREQQHHRSSRGRDGDRDRGGVGGRSRGRNDVRASAPRHVRGNTLPGYSTVVAPQNAPLEDKTQPLQNRLVNQYNSFNRVNCQNLTNHLDPTAPDIQPYPPSYDILFPTDG